MEEALIKKAYEISYLLRQEEDAQIIPKLVLELGGDVISESPVAEIRLAYPIKKENRAYFGYAHFNSDPSSIEKLNESLKLNKQVLRFIVVTPPFVKIPSRRSGDAQGFRPEPMVQPELSNDALEEKLEEIKI